MSKRLEIPALKVNQWIKDWDTVQFDDRSHQNNRKQPLQYFFVFSIKAGLLKKLSKVYPRTRSEKSEIEYGIQRKHDPKRSLEITEYIKYGYPLSEMKKSRKDFSDLQMPGWLPTAIVANILKKGTKRGGDTIVDSDLIILEDKNTTKLILPEGASNKKWTPKVPPLEIIDGQHRLWAFSDSEIADEYELPVVAFYDLDITWQAYLFYTINVKPKKINRSLAYDLYPLLRVQEWLEKAPDTAFVYKETRAQEIVEVLWSYGDSPWKGRINMLGDMNSEANITQAAFIRNLIASFIKTTNSQGLGGLFGAKLLDKYNMPLSWNRTQQASFIIYIWQIMYETIAKYKHGWAEKLRENARESSDSLFGTTSPVLDLAFISKFSLLSSDQGVRGFLHIVNDFIFKQSEQLKLRDINWSIATEEIKEDRIEHNDVKIIIKDLKKSSINDLVIKLCKELVKFDWRTSSEPHLLLDPDLRRKQMVFKGSSGYKELRSQLIQMLINSSDKDIKKTASEIWGLLGYAK